jgi:glycine/D-amino acid oxidase-like deaminating enzyme
MRSTGDATHARNLRTGVPVWFPHGEPDELARPLTGSLSVDVAIVGGGVSGALVADALLQAGKRVVVLDRRGLVRGSTPASTALLQFEIDQPLTVLGETIGHDRAARAYWRSAAAIDHLRGRIADLGLRCGFRERHSAYLPGNVLDIAGLRREAAARERIGLRSRFIGSDELRRQTLIDGAGAIWSAGAAEVDPVRLVRGLWRSIIARGGAAYAPVEVIDIDSGRKGVTLTTDGGATVRATSVILATGYETAKILFPAGTPAGTKVISTWVLATAPQPRALWPSRCLIWEAGDPYLYIRTTVDHRIVIGGEDQAFSDDAHRDRLIPRKIKRIQAKLHRLLPMVDTAADFAWAGCFGESATGLPVIGAVPGARGCYAVMGFGGNGITFSVIAAQMLRRAVLGLPDPDRDLFAFGQPPGQA